MSDSEEKMLLRIPNIAINGNKYLKVIDIVGEMAGFGLGWEKERTAKQPYPMYRYLACYLMIKETRLQPAQIGRLMGIDRSTVYHSIKKWEDVNLLKNKKGVYIYPKMAEMYNNAKAQLSEY